MQYRIKPLVWTEAYGEEIAKIPGGILCVGGSEGWGFWQVNQCKIREEKSRNAAKLAAESWYRERLLEALEPVEE